MKLYGIKNCNAVKKGCEFVEHLGFEYEFLDIKKLDEATLQGWLKQKSFDILINTAGLSAKKLGLNKEKVLNLSKNTSGQNELKKLILQSPTLIKRPVIEYKGQIYIGKEYEDLKKLIHS